MLFIDRPISAESHALSPTPSPHGWINYAGNPRPVLKCLLLLGATTPASDTQADARCWCGVRRPPAQLTSPVRCSTQRHRWPCLRGSIRACRGLRPGAGSPGLRASRLPRAIRRCPACELLWRRPWSWRCNACPNVNRNASGSGQAVRAPTGRTSPGFPRDKHLIRISNMPPLHLNVKATNHAHDELHRLEARCCWRDDRNEDKRFLPGIKHTMNFSAMGYQHISLGDGNGLPVRTDAVLAAT